MLLRIQAAFCFALWAVVTLILCAFIAVGIGFYWCCNQTLRLFR